MNANMRKAKMALKTYSQEEIVEMTGISINTLKKYAADPKILENAKWTTVKALGDMLSEADYQSARLAEGDWDLREVPEDYSTTLFDGSRHQKSFLEMYHRLPANHQSSVYWLSALYVLTASEDFVRNIDAFVQFDCESDPDGPYLRVGDFDVITGDLSSGEIEMVLVAFNLYNGFNLQGQGSNTPFLDDVFGRSIIMSKLYYRAIQIRFEWYMTGRDYQKFFNNL